MGCDGRCTDADAYSNACLDWGYTCRWCRCCNVAVDDDDDDDWMWCSIKTGSSLVLDATRVVSELDRCVCVW